MKRILAAIFAITVFGLPNLAHGQSLYYDSPDSVVFYDIELPTGDTGGSADTLTIDVQIYIVKGFKADKNGDGNFGCEDTYILQGNKNSWNKIRYWIIGSHNEDKIQIHETSEKCDGGHRWSFSIDSSVKDTLWDASDWGPSEEQYNDEDIYGKYGYEAILSFWAWHPTPSIALLDVRVKIFVVDSKNDLPVTTLSSKFGPIDNVPSSVSIKSEELPTNVRLLQNYPNPFNPETAIEYELGQAGLVRLDVFDAMGRSVAVLADGVQPAGRYSLRFDATRLPSGLYVYRLQADGETLTRKMTLIR